jgi:protein subunit release factor A
MKPAPRLSAPPYPTDRATIEREVVIERLRVRGPGGQHRNVTESGIRLTHLPSGVRVVATESRSQHRNREVAFERLTARLERLNAVPASRIPTRATGAAVERRLRTKKRRQMAKQLRKAVREEE